MGRYIDVAAHPPGGLELGQRFLEPPGGIGGLPARLPHDRDPCRAGASSEGVLVGGLGIGVEQPSSSDQVPRHPSSQLLRQRLQLVGDDLVELVAGDVVRNRRTVVLSLDRRALVRRQLVAAPSARRYCASGPCSGRSGSRSILRACHRGRLAACRSQRLAPRHRGDGRTLAGASDALSWSLRGAACQPRPVDRARPERLLPLCDGLRLPFEGPLLASASVVGHDAAILPRLDVSSRPQYAEKR